MIQSLLEETRARVEAYLRTMMYKDACVARYNHTWDHLADYMKANGIELYSREVGDAFLSAWHEGKDYKQLTRRQKERLCHGAAGREVKMSVAVAHESLSRRYWRQMRRPFARMSRYGAVVATITRGKRGNAWRAGNSALPLQCQKEETPLQA